MARKSFKQQSVDIREERRRSTLPTFSKSGKFATYNHYVDNFTDSKLALNCILETMVALEEAEVVAAISNKPRNFIERITSHHWALADQFNIGENVDEIAFDKFINEMRRISRLQVEVDHVKPRAKPFSRRVEDIVAEIESIVDAEVFGRISQMTKPRNIVPQIERIRRIYNPSPDVWKTVLAFFDKQRHEVYQALQGTLTEGYEHWKKVQLKAIYQVYCDIVGQQTSYSTIKASKTKRVIHKTPKTKTKTEKAKQKEKISNVAALVENTKAVILYTAKYKQITVLFAEKGQVLTTKRKTINGVDESRSFFKRFSVNRHKINSLSKMSFDKVLMFVEQTSQTKNAATTRIRDDYERIVWIAQ